MLLLYPKVNVKKSNALLLKLNLDILDKTIVSNLDSSSCFANKMDNTVANNIQYLNLPLTINNPSTKRKTTILPT